MVDSTWRLLWKSYMLLIVAVLAAAAAGVGGMFYQEEVHHQVATMEDKIKSFHRSHQVQKEAQRLMGQYQPIYEQFDRKGIFNQEPRLQWLDTVGAIGQELKFETPVNYKLEVRAPFDVPFILPPGGYILYSSAMTLTLNLLHEGDFFNYFKLLKQRAPGVFDVSSCNIQRTPKRITLNGKSEWTTSLEAKCVVQWFTMWLKEDTH